MSVQVKLIFSKLLEEGSWALRKKTNQTEKSVSWGPLCPVRTKTHTHTHTESGHTLSGLSSVYITYEFWHAAYLRVTKSAVFCVCVDNHSSHPYLAPVGLFRGAGKQNHIYTRKHMHTHTPASFPRLFFSPLPLSLSYTSSGSYSPPHVNLTHLFFI